MWQDAEGAASFRNRGQGVARRTEKSTSDKGEFAVVAQRQSEYALTVFVFFSDKIRRVAKIRPTIGGWHCEREQASG